MEHSKKYLTTAILLSLMLPLHPAEAYTDEYISAGKKLIFDTTFIEQGDPMWEGEAYTLSAEMKEGFVEATNYWLNILSPHSRAKSPLQLLVTPQNELDNLYGDSSSYKDGEAKSVNHVKMAIQQGLALERDDNIAELEYEAPTMFGGCISVTIGNQVGGVRPGSQYGYWIDSSGLLPAGQQSMDYIGAIRHELCHGLGFKTTSTLVPSEEYTVPAFGDFSEDPYDFTWHLYDKNLNQAQPNMQILTTDEFNQLENASASDYFILDVPYAEDSSKVGGYRELTAAEIEIKRQTDPRYNTAFFIGDKVTEVLNGKTWYGVSGVPMGTIEISSGEVSGQNAISHTRLPVLMSHVQYCNYTTLTELELAMMQDIGYEFDRKAYYGRSIYNDNLTLTNTMGYSARNAEETAYLPEVYSQVPYGMGLHVFGTKNNIIQAGDILTRGYAAAGIRVDGLENTITIPKDTQVHADGSNGVGVLISYGRSHELNQAGTVTADGPNGKGVQFDFGSSSNGIEDLYLGSYMAYQRYGAGYFSTGDRKIEPGEIGMARNKALPLTEVRATAYQADELQGALVDNYNLSGALSGAKDAIYIGKTALVKNINLLEGASVSGNITSDWKHLDWENDGVLSEDGTELYTDGKILMEALDLQYNGGMYNYTSYIPDLVTSLNFNQTSTMNYAGNINCFDNIRLNVNSGTLSYDGVADVVNVNVAEAARLVGGTYKVNDVLNGSYSINGRTIEMPGNFTDDTVGKFINSGTIGAAVPVNSDSSMSIQGQLVNKGTLQMTANGNYRGYIDVDNLTEGSGKVLSEGRLAADNTYTLAIAPEGKYLPGVNYMNFVREKGEVQEISYINDSINFSKGLLTARYDKENRSLTFDAASSIAGATQQQNETLQDMNAVLERNTALGNTVVTQNMTELYNMSEEHAQVTLDEIRGDSSADGIAPLQSSQVLSGAVSSRMAYVNRGNTAGAGGNRRLSGCLAYTSRTDATGEGDIIPLGDEDSVRNGGWLKFAKSWSRLDNGAVRLHGSAVTAGYDRQVSKDWRLGGLVSYGRNSLGSRNTSLKTDDWRFGIYGGCQSGPHDAYIYADYGYQKNDIARGFTYMSGRAEADYSGRILELGGEYKYDLHHADGRIWHVSPYAGLQLSHYTQGGYSETGMPGFNKNVHSFSGNYIAAEAGLELKRLLPQGELTARAGYKHVFTGTDPRLTFNYSDAPDITREVTDSRDKNFLTLGLSYSHKLQNDWSIEASADLQKGAHDQGYMGSITLRKSW